MPMRNHGLFDLDVAVVVVAAAAHGDGTVLLFLLSVCVAAALPWAAAQTGTESASNYPYTNTDMASSAFIIVFMVCAFVFVALATVYIVQCRDAGGDTNARNSASTAPFRLAMRGLDPAVINSFPVFDYAHVKGLQIGKGALECAVCITEFEDNETLRLLPKCDHVFHLDCIDAWLASHSTCPVCREDLAPESGKFPDGSVPGTDSNFSTSEEPNSRSELRIVHDNQTSINVDDNPNPNPNQNQNRRQVAKLRRSHSTGHSLVRPGENCERYTLRLPEEVRKQVLTQALKRTTSCVFVFPTEESSRKGYRSGGEGSGRGRQIERPDRWIFTRTPPFFSRTGPVESPKAGVDGDLTGTSKLWWTYVKTPSSSLPV